MGPLGAGRGQPGRIVVTGDHPGLYSLTTTLIRKDFIRIFKFVRQRWLDPLARPAILDSTVDH
ncbi:hypothetical protein PRIPAC_88615 [Pristionchus pacificus]|uniref:Uncharacterized protein n=1 Tax=Pristionchus pacificus TaxID=54126 RepID=A0A2A6CYC4_PRIPA|nr:hypothetical protein PRIPAC_88615 [Pristionchus pacificus]|eukprot:PDM83067.1 hypothetical protein PRIPAC_37460 [Pristionchus pacificus]